MFKDIRRKDREIQGERVRELLNSCEYGFLSLGIAENGYAYGIPMSYAYDEDSSSLYFHSANNGQKLEVIEKNAKVSFCIVTNTCVLAQSFSTKYESVIVYGDIEIITENKEKIKALHYLIEKYSQSYLSEGEMYIEKAQHKTTVFKITIRHVSAKARY